MDLIETLNASELHNVLVSIAGENIISERESTQ